MDKRRAKPLYTSLRKPLSLPIRSQGLEKYSKSTDNLYVGEAHQRHYIPATPGPGHYKHRTAVGKQVYSKNKQHGSHTFSKTDRFGYVDMANRKNATPGPGSYVA